MDKKLALACVSEQKLFYVGAKLGIVLKAKLPENFTNKLSPFKFAQHVTCSFSKNCTKTGAKISFYRIKIPTCTIVEPPPGCGSSVLHLHRFPLKENLQDIALCQLLPRLIALLN